jgi:DNA-binding LacI/PurR family transcriptional regulator
VQHEYERVCGAIRAQIMAGDYPPGSRLPSFAEFGRTLNVGQATVQKALGQLVQDGFVRTAHRAGTFVTDALPHRSRLALLVPKVMHGDLLYRAIIRAAQWVAENSRWQLVQYPTGGRRDMPDDTTRLVDDLAHYRVGGLIFAGTCEAGHAAPQLTDPALPRAAYQSLPEDGVSAIRPDLAGFIRRATEHALTRRCRRVAVLHLDAGHAGVEEGLLDRLRLAACPVEPHLIQYISLGWDRRRSVASVLRLLMALGRSRRPDALIVHDDNLVADVVAALLTLGIRVPDDLNVVALANFPLAEGDAQLPLVRIGFDQREYLCRAIASICCRLRGEAPPSVHVLPAITEAEFDAARPSVPDPLT